MAKSGSFGFAEALAFCVGAKPNVPLVLLVKRNLKKCEGLAFSFFPVNCPNSKTRDTDFISCQIVKLVNKLFYLFFLNKSNQFTFYVCHTKSGTLYPFF